MKSTKKQKSSVISRRAGLAAVALASSLLSGFSHVAVAETYAIEFIAAQGKGFLLNDAGTMVGINTTRGWCPGPYPACYSLDTVVAWPAGGGSPVPLPAPPGLPQLLPRGMNAAGWIAGTASVFSVDFRPQPVVWQPNTVGYSVQQLGLLPGNTLAKVAGIDDFNRVVGYDTIDNILPPNAAPFLWSPAGGLSNLTDQGFPNDIPLAISPKGTVALSYRWYKLDVPGVVTPNAALPPGFVGASSGLINDAGDQARFLITSGSANLAYFFRYVAGTRLWQQLSPAGTGRLSHYGIGSIDNKRDITGTVLGSGVYAAGPSGLAQSLAALLSPAYGGIPVTNAGPRNASGKIVANVMLGRSPGRLVRLVPVNACTTSCIRVASLQMTARPVSTCKNTNLVTATLTVTDEAGGLLSGVTLKGRFLDDYYLNKTVSGITNSNGVVRFIHRGPACVGAIAFLADTAKSTGRVFDRTQGRLTNYVIPVP
jgi:hypothetical protein